MCPSTLHCAASWRSPPSPLKGESRPCSSPSLLMRTICCSSLRALLFLGLLHFHCRFPAAVDVVIVYNIGSSIVQHVQVAHSTCSLPCFFSHTKHHQGIPLCFHDNFTACNYRLHMYQSKTTWTYISKILSEQEAVIRFKYHIA